MKTCIIIVCCLYIITACNNKDSNNRRTATSYTYSLEKSDININFPRDENTLYLIKSIFTYEDSLGNKYLTFQNDRYNEILFYDIPSRKLLFKLNLEYEGADGVGNMLGYHISSLDEIYLTFFERPQIIVVDTAAHVKRRIDFSKNNLGNTIMSSISGSQIYTPLSIIDNRIYITQIPRFGEEITHSPVSIYFDEKTSLSYDLPFYFPALIDNSEKDNVASNFANFSREYDGEHFIYSFFFDENIYVTSIDHKQIQKIPVKSKYIKNLKIRQRGSNVNIGTKLLGETANYGNLLYDKYRNVYYRFVYPETELDKNENFPQIMQTGRKKFSIIILDKEFNIIGETLFPDYIYMSNVFFIEKEGLYISNSHYKNPDFDEDKLSFICFRLTKTE